MAQVAEIKQPVDVSFMSEIWEEFSSIDLTGYTKTLKHANNATYLPWSNCWSLVMQRYPCSTFTFREPVVYANNSVEIWCALTITDGERFASREMWLPVMDGKNNAVFDPSSRGVSDTRMRCLVKCAALFGLGVHLYSGDDLPKLDSAPKLPHGVITAEQIAYLTDKLATTESDLDAFLKFFSVESLESLPAAKYQNAKALLDAKAKRAEQ